MTSIAPAPKPINFFARKMIDSFGFDKVRYYPSGVDGTDCVEYLDGDKILKSEETEVLARRIHRYKKDMAKMAARIAAK